MKLILEEDDILTFIKGITASFQPLAEVKGIKLTFGCQMNSLYAAFDKDKLEKILSNLLINAIKYTPNSLTSEKEGTIFVTVTKDLSERNKNRMIGIIIEDSGIGITHDVIKNIFNRFFTERGKLISEIPSGTGIGLALVKELVELHYGNISVESEMEKGTRFKIELPYEKEFYKNLELEISPNRSLTEGNQEQLKNLNIEIKKDDKNEEVPLILVVEDNDDMRKFILENLGYNIRILESANGRDAIKKAVNYIPDLVLTDVLMQEMDGIQLCEKIKTDERTCHIPVILLTSRSETENKIKGLNTGADDYITKPFRVAELHTRMHNLINQRKILRRKYRKEIILEPKEIKAASLDEKFLERIITIIEQNISDFEFSVEELAKKAGLSRMQLHRKINALTGQSSNDLIKSYRLNKAAKILLTKSGNISEVGYEVGFINPSYFATASRIFSAALLPNIYRNILPSKVKMFNS